MMTIVGNLFYAVTVVILFVIAMNIALLRGVKYSEGLYNFREGVNLPVYRYIRHYAVMTIKL